MKLLHFSDVHYDADPEKLAKCEASMAFIISQAADIKPDLIIMSGDLFHRRQALESKSAILPAHQAIQQLAEIAPLVMVYGNHDVPGSLDLFRLINSFHPIYVADRAETIYYFKGCGFKRYEDGPETDRADAVPDAILHLLPYLTKAHFLAAVDPGSIDESNQLIQEALKGLFAGWGVISAEAQCPVVMVAHCNVSGSTLSTGQVLLGQDIMVSKHDLALARADYVALGHIHRAQEVGDKMYYSGSVYHGNFGETEVKSFAVVTIDEDRKTTIYPVVIPSRPLSLHELHWDPDLKMFWDSDDAPDWIGADLRVRIYQTKEQAGLHTDEAIRERFAGAHSFQIERIPIPDERVRSGEIVKAQTLAQKVGEWGSVVEKTIAPEVLELAAKVEAETTTGGVK